MDENVEDYGPHPNGLRAVLEIQEQRPESIKRTDSRMLTLIANKGSCDMTGKSIFGFMPHIQRVCLFIHDNNMIELT